MAELAENEPVCMAFVLIKKNYQVLYFGVIMFGIRKGKTGNIIVTNLELYLFLGLNYPILGTEKSLNSCTVCCD